MTEMDLKTYLQSLDVPERESFASRCGTTRGHLQNVMYRLRPCAAELAVAIERESKGHVTRRDLRNDWKAIWPELAEKDDGKRSNGNPQQRAVAHVADHPKAQAR